VSKTKKIDELRELINVCLVPGALVTVNVPSEEKRVTLIFKGDDSVMHFALDLYKEMIEGHSFGSVVMSATEDEDLRPTYTLDWLNIPEPWDTERVLSTILQEARGVL